MANSDLILSPRPSDFGLGWAEQIHGLRYDSDKGTVLDGPGTEQAGNK